MTDANQSDAVVVLLELAERCEMEGQNYHEIDALIYVALHPGVRMATSGDRSEDGDIGRYDIMQPNFLGEASRTAPNYTGSLDEAVKLIPKDFAWHTQWVGIEPHAASASLWLPPARTKGWANERFDCFEAPTPALAICASALRAHSAGGEKG